jgi:hypothetical protein
MKIELPNEALHLSALFRNDFQEEKNKYFGQVSTVCLAQVVLGVKYQWGC